MPADGHPAGPVVDLRAGERAYLTQGGVIDRILAAGTQLPPVRRMADDHGLAVNTAARAYRELEAAGLVETHGRGGTVVTAAGSDARALAGRGPGLRLTRPRPRRCSP